LGEREKKWGEKKKKGGIEALSTKKATLIKGPGVRTALCRGE